MEFYDNIDGDNMHKIAYEKIINNEKIKTNNDNFFTKFKMPNEKYSEIELNLEKYKYSLDDIILFFYNKIKKKYMFFFKKSICVHFSSSDYTYENRIWLYLCRKRIIDLSLALCINNIINDKKLQNKEELMSMCKAISVGSQTSTSDYDISYSGLYNVELYKKFKEFTNEKLNCDVSILFDTNLYVIGFLKRINEIETIETIKQKKITCDFDCILMQIVNINKKKYLTPANCDITNQYIWSLIKIHMYFIPFLKNKYESIYEKIKTILNNMRITDSNSIFNKSLLMFYIFHSYEKKYFNEKIFQNPEYSQHKNYVINLHECNNKYYNIFNEQQTTKIKISKKDFMQLSTLISNNPQFPDNNFSNLQCNNINKNDSYLNILKCNEKILKKTLEIFKFNNPSDLISADSFYEDETYLTRGAYIHVVFCIQQNISLLDLSEVLQKDELKCSILEQIGDLVKELLLETNDIIKFSKYYARIQHAFYLLSNKDEYLNNFKNINSCKQQNNSNNFREILKKDNIFSNNDMNFNIKHILKIMNIINDFFLKSNINH
jgi:hypothetical protein